MHFDEASMALVEFAASRHNAFHSSEVAEIINRHRLRRAEQRGLLRRLHPRVWSVVALGQPPGQTARAATLARRGSAIGHRTAAWLHGWLPQRPPQVDLWVPSSARTSNAYASRFWCRRVEPCRDVQTIDHIPVLNPAATLCLLGRVAPPSTVERCLDEFTRSHSMAWLAKTLHRLDTGNCRGVATLSAILTSPKRVDGVTESWFERLVADLVNRGDLPPIELQFPIEIDGVRRAPFRVDIAFPSVRLGIEAHSRSFHWGAAKVDADNRRDVLVSAAGWQLLYVTWAQVQDRERFVDDIVRAVQARHALFAGETVRS